MAEKKCLFDRLVYTDKSGISEFYVVEEATGARIAARGYLHEMKVGMRLLLEGVTPPGDDGFVSYESAHTVIGTEEGYAKAFDEEKLKAEFNVQKADNFVRLGGYEKVLRINYLRRNLFKRTLLVAHQQHIVAQGIELFCVVYSHSGTCSGY